MKFKILAYRTIPVTFLIVSIYVTIFTALFLSESVSDIPQDTHGLDVDRAYADLHNITLHPHPYHSHANDLVRTFLLSRVEEITAGCDYAHAEEDANLTTLWNNGPNATVFHASNILVKIDGYDGRFVDSGGVLFSAHYDSVSTAPGTTDDGIAVVSLLQLIEHLVKNRPRRTAIFNINNGEEDGLYGARAFVRHPWAKIGDTFINVEGAGAGGPPLLFRATSLEPVKAFARGLTTNSTTYRVQHPHGNVLSADAFSRGVVRSGTDYSVYIGDEDRTLAGVDLAFYQHRSRYHTMYDSIPGAKGKAKEALWAMLENIWGAGGVLLNVEPTKSQVDKAAVYFDLFKSFFIVFELDSLHIFNLVLLFAGPALVLSSHVALPFFCGHFGAEVEEEEPSLLSRVFGMFRLPRRREPEEAPSGGILSSLLAYVGKTWSWGNFWVPTVLFVPSAILHVITTKVLLSVNKYITYSQQYTVMVLNLSLALIVITFLLGSPAISARLRSPRTNSAYALPDRQVILLYLYIFTYLLLILAAYAVKARIGGLYWISAWHACVCVACTIGGTETFVARCQRVRERRRKKKRRILLSRDANRAARNDQSFGGGSTTDSDEETTETTPLLPGSTTLPELKEDVVDRKDNSVWWILQVLLTVPIPVMLLGHVLVLFQGALGQTLSDGSGAAFVYAVESLICFLLVLPVAPFASGIHRYVTYIATAGFLGTLIFNLTAFPFSQETPLKVFFQQSVQLNSTSPSNALVAGGVVRATTSFIGVPELIENQVVSQLPSSWGKDVQCSMDKAGRWTGLVTCSWDSGADMIPYPGGRAKHPWLTIAAERLSPFKVRLEVEGKNARSCRVYFEKMQIVQVSLKGDMPLLTLSPGEDGGMFKYWNREWEKRFTMEVNLNGFDGANMTVLENQRSDALRTLRGRVACEWVEYESGMVGLDPSRSKGAGYLNPKMPALEEIFRFLPQWAIVSKAADGLVEGWSEFGV